MTTSEKELDSIKEKIEKLLNKAESAKQIGSLEEAAAFAAKASNLLMKYNLCMSDIGGKPKDDMEVGRIDLGELHGFNKTEGDWVVQLYNAIAKFNLCRVIKVNMPGHMKIVIIGDKFNTETVMYIAGQLVNRLKELQRERFKQYKGTEKKGTFKRSYFIGAVNGIWDKLEENKKAQEVENVNVTALVRTNELELQSKVEEVFADSLKTGKARKSKGQDGSFYGYQDGKRMNVNPGLNEKSKQHKTIE